MKLNEYPKNLPEQLKPEYEKYLNNPDKYKKLYPVCWKLLQKYIGQSNG